MSFNGASRWMSPELLDIDVGDDMMATTASDMWALGCTLLEVRGSQRVYLIDTVSNLKHQIVTEELPYSTCKHDLQVQQQVIAGHYPGSHNKLFEVASLDLLWPMLESCWKLLPGDRPTVSMLADKFSEACPQSVSGGPSLLHLTKRRAHKADPDAGSHDYLGFSRDHPQEIPAPGNAGNPEPRSIIDLFNFFFFFFVFVTLYILSIFIYFYFIFLLLWFLFILFPIWFLYLSMIFLTWESAPTIKTHAKERQRETRSAKQEVARA